MNILVINVHSFFNAGDNVLNKVAVQQLKKQFPEATITFSMNDPDSIDISYVSAVGSFQYWAKKEGIRWNWWSLFQIGKDSLLFFAQQQFFSKWKKVVSKPWSHLFKAYAAADIVVSCPGNFLYSSGRVGIPFLLTLYSMLFAWLLKKPVYMFPQTIGPITKIWEKKFLRFTLKRVRIIMVRDPISLMEIKRIGLKHPACYLVPDMAFAYSVASSPMGKQLLDEFGVDIARHSPLLGVTLINWGAQNGRFKDQLRYESSMADAIRYFIHKYGGNAILFSQVQGPTINDDDRIPASRVYAQLEDVKQAVVFIDRETSQIELKAAYKYMDLFIGSRLHSNIFALSDSVPVVAIQYQYKTQGIMRMLNLEQWTIKIEEVSGETLINLLDKAWIKRKITREQIQKQLPRIVAEIQQSSRLIAEDYYDLLNVNG